MNDKWGRRIQWWRGDEVLCENSENVISDENTYDSPEREHFYSSHAEPEEHYYSSWRYRTGQDSPQDSPESRRTSRSNSPEYRTQRQDFSPGFRQRSSHEEETRHDEEEIPVFDEEPEQYDQNDDITGQTHMRRTRPAKRYNFKHHEEVEILSENLNRINEEINDIAQALIRLSCNLKYVRRRLWSIENKTSKQRQRRTSH